MGSSTQDLNRLSRAQVTCLWFYLLSPFLVNTFQKSPVLLWMIDREKGSWLEEQRKILFPASPPPLKR